MKRILLVEDYEEKANNILAFLKQEFPECEVIQRSSYNSAQEEIFEHGSDYSLILLDASGGLPEPSAGQYILEGMFLRQIMTPVVVVTMYNVFGRKQLDAFDVDLKKDYPQNYKSYVYYSSQKNDWKNHLKKQIKEILL